MKVELIYDLDCPNVAAARMQLLRAFSDAGLDALWTEWDLASGDSPAYVRHFGSPTILVDGQDVVPEELAAVASCCRLYRNGAGAMERVPAIESIASAIRKSSARPAIPIHPKGIKPAWKTTIAAVPSVGVALLPKLTCAACWPAYASLMGALGFGFFDYTAYLLPITVAALGLTLATLAWRAKAGWGYGPLVLGGIAAMLHLLGKFVLDSNVIAYTAVPILISAAVWNVWPRKVTPGSCDSCASN